MKVKELIKKLKDVPQNAEVYIEADHGQLAEQASSLGFTYDDELPYYGDDISFKYTINTFSKKKVTAVIITY